MQRRKTSTSLAKRGWILVCGSGPSVVSFPPDPAFDDRSWLSQSGISLASGALSSWWMRLELSPVAPALLRIDSPAWWAETMAQIRSV
jgi:hypothetical protein